MVVPRAGRMALVHSSYVDEGFLFAVLTAVLFALMILIARRNQAIRRMRGDRARRNDMNTYPSGDANLWERA